MAKNISTHRHFSLPQKSMSSVGYGMIRRLARRYNLDSLFYGPIIWTMVFDFELSLKSTLKVTGVLLMPIR